MCLKEGKSQNVTEVTYVIEILQKLGGVLSRGGKKVRISVMPFTCGLFRLNSLFSLVT